MKAAASALWIWVYVCACNSSVGVHRLPRGDKTMKIISHTSVLCALATMAMAHDATAVVRVGNASRTYADAYSQVNNQRAGIITLDSDDALDAAIADLPVRVANRTMARKILNGDSDVASIKQLSSCAEIYPNGEFAWDRPTVGIKRGQTAQCVATVEMRVFNGAPGGGDLVVARANLASGDSVKCNISDFPADTYLDAAGNVTFPADAAPTRDDVIKIMNQEQKKGAGLKIAAGTIIGGVFGNMAGKNQVGHDGILGGGKSKLTGAAAGATAGAAIMAGNAYAGKMAGDMILSTGVNAAAGAVMGNIVAAASDAEVLYIEDCKLPNGTTDKCLWGVLIATDEPQESQAAFYNTTSRTSVLCNVIDTNEFTNCNPRELLSVSVEKYADKTVDELTTQEFNNIGDGVSIYYLDTADGKSKMMTTQPGGGDNESYVKIASYKLGGKRTSAMISGIKDKAFGLKKSDWTEMRDGFKDSLYLRDSSGNATALDKNQNYSIDNFYPMYRDADNGGIINLSNKARLKGTLIGTGVGGAMGAFTAYQGANDDIEDRFNTAKREYDDSLRNFYCATGNRHLGQYNSIISIPVKLD